MLWHTLAGPFSTIGSSLVKDDFKVARSVTNLGNRVQQNGQLYAKG